MSREALVLLVCCCDFRDGAKRLIPSKSLRNAVIRAFPGLFRILRMCAPRRAAAVVRPRGREKSADRRRRILISRLLIIRASVPRRKSPFPAYFKGFPAVSPLIPPYPAFLKYPVSPHTCLIFFCFRIARIFAPILISCLIFCSIRPSKLNQFRSIIGFILWSKDLQKVLVSVHFRIDSAKQKRRFAALNAPPHFLFDTPKRKCACTVEKKKCLG